MSASDRTAPTSLDALLGYRAAHAEEPESRRVWLFHAHASFDHESPAAVLEARAFMDRAARAPTSSLLPADPPAVRVRAEWRRKADIVANIDPRESAEVIGPAPSIVERSTGIEQHAILLGQPQTSPLQDHVVMLFAEPIPVATGADSATGIFLGGWDFHENKSPDTARMLVFVYPVERNEAGPPGSG